MDQTPETTFTGRLCTTRVGFSPRGTLGTGKVPGREFLGQEARPARWRCSPALPPLYKRCAVTFHSLSPPMNNKSDSESPVLLADGSHIPSVSHSLLIERHLREPGNQLTSRPLCHRPKLVPVTIQLLHRRLPRQQRKSTRPRHHGHARAPHTRQYMPVSRPCMAGRPGTSEITREKHVLCTLRAVTAAAMV